LWKNEAGLEINLQNKMNKHIRNEYFPWMEGIYGKAQLDRSLKGAQVESWDVFWCDDPQTFYGFIAYIFWKSVCGKYGYDYVYYYSYDNTTIHHSSGPFDSLADMKREFETKGGQDMQFPNAQLT
jgi:hypothetical protein